MKVQKADPGAQRLTAMLILAAIVVGGLSLLAARAFRPQLEAWVEQDLIVRLRMIMAVLMLFTAGPLLGLGAYLWRLGARVIRDRRYPPNGMRALQDIAIIEGEGAGLRGRTFKWLGLGVIAAGTVMVLVMWRLVLLFEEIGRR